MAEYSATILNREIDESLYVPAASSTIYGVVGAAHKGEKNTIIEVGSQAEYVRKLGIPTTPMGYAVFEYLRKGRRALCVRVANGDVKATVEVDDASDVKTFDIFAKTSGEWANGLLVYIVASISGAGKFKLVIEENGYPIETWENLDLNNLESNINDTETGSEYITVTNDAGNTNLPKVQTVELVGGVSGIAGLTDADYIGTVTGNTKTGLQLFKNVEEVEVDLLSIPGNSDSDVITALQTMLDWRKDVYGMIDPPFGLSVDEVIQFYNGEGAWSGSHQAINSHRVCVDWPWHKVYNAYLSQPVWVAPSGITAGVIAYSDYVGKPWRAAAGYERGRVTESLEIEHSPDFDERNRLNGYNKINPYVNFKGEGIMRWGADTTYRTPSALGSEEVRRMIFFAQKQMISVCRRLHFEPNTPRLWSKMRKLASGVLDPIQADEGLYDYRVVADNTTTTDAHIDREEVNMKLLVKPTRKAKVISLDWTILRSGAKFEEYI